MFSTLSQPTWRRVLSSTGNVAFFANLAGTNAGTADDTGIFCRNAAGDSVVRIVQEGDPVPGGGGTLTPHATLPAINASGEVAFRSGLEGVSGSSPQAIVRGNGQTRTLIAKDGMAVAGVGTIDDLGVGVNVALNAGGKVAFHARLRLNVLQAGMNGFNDASEVAFRFELADGREGIAL